MSIAILDSSGSRWRCSGSSYHSIADVLSLLISSGSLRYCSNSSPVVCIPPLLVAFRFLRALIRCRNSPLLTRNKISQKLKKLSVLVKISVEACNSAGEPRV